MRSVEGRIRNNAADTYRSVAVEIDLFDADGKSLYTRTVTLRELRPREEKTFRTWLLPGEPRKFEVRRISGVSRSAL